MKIKMMVIVILAALIMAVVTFQNLSPKQQVYAECYSDSDCVPDECCHAKACTSKENAPDCTGVMCTMECRPGTMDCGQGYCSCIDNKCTAFFESIE